MTQIPSSSVGLIWTVWLTLIVQKMQHFPLFYLNLTSIKPVNTPGLCNSHHYSTSVLRVFRLFSTLSWHSTSEERVHKLFWQQSIRIAAGQMEHHLWSQETAAASCFAVSRPLKPLLPCRKTTTCFKTSNTQPVSDQDGLVPLLPASDGKLSCYKNL